MLISVQLTSFLTNVVLSGDFSVYAGLTESEKLSLEGTDVDINMCYLNLSLSAPIIIAAGYVYA